MIKDRSHVVDDALWVECRIARSAAAGVAELLQCMSIRQIHFLGVADEGDRSITQRVSSLNAQSGLLTDLTVSLIFVGNSLGALLAGTTNVFITDLIGYRFVSGPRHFRTIIYHRLMKPPDGPSWCFVSYAGICCHGSRSALPVLSRRNRYRRFRTQSTGKSLPLHEWASQATSDWSRMPKSTT